MASESGDGAAGVIQPGTVNAPEFPAGLDWINAEAPVTIRQLRGRIVLLDFWTHCCINCIHALEDLKRLERKHGANLVVIGVHSAKFDAEKDTARIRHAVRRLGIGHPVVNDREMRVWQEYAVRAWPTFMLVDPRGKVVGSHSGERVFELFDRVISEMVEHFGRTGELRREASDAGPASADAPASALSYPGKVLADPEGGRLFIADTNHNRIVVAALRDGAVTQVIGSGRPGLADGAAGEARFTRPNGMALAGRTLYVADTGNHSIRRVDLADGAVSTLVGDGLQDEQWDSSPAPLQGQRLNSPWDLQLAHGVLFVAMAGNHRVYGIDLEGCYIAGHAGSGREDHVDGPLMAAAMAQPSGLATDGETLFVADSEISSIRAVSLDPRGGHVRTVVGRGLFDFGDVDGAGAAVRLQHPTGVAWADGGLCVADTFNNKIKRIALPECRVRTLAGTGAPGYRDGAAAEARFDEPGGISIAGRTLYVADTNNHAIRAVDLETGAVSAWPLKGLDRLVGEAGDPRALPQRAVRAGSVSVRVRVGLPPGHTFGPHAHSGVKLLVGDRTFQADLRDGEAEVSVGLAHDATVRVEAVAHYCKEGAGACLYLHEARLLPLRIDSGGSSELEVDFAAAAL